MAPLINSTKKEPVKKNIPKLEQAIEELEQINEKTEVLAENMRIYLDPFNMEELQHILEEIDYD
jgi:hypothetical protein